MTMTMMRAIIMIIKRSSRKGGGGFLCLSTPSTATVYFNLVQNNNTSYLSRRLYRHHPHPPHLHCRKYDRIPREVFRTCRLWVVLEYGTDNRLNKIVSIRKTRQWYPPYPNDQTVHNKQPRFKLQESYLGFVCIQVMLLRYSIVDLRTWRVPVLHGPTHEHIPHIIILELDPKYCRQTLSEGIPNNDNMNNTNTNTMLFRTRRRRKQTVVQNDTSYYFCWYVSLARFHPSLLLLKMTNINRRNWSCRA